MDKKLKISALYKIFIFVFLYSFFLFLPGKTSIAQEFNPNNLPSVVSPAYLFVIPKTESDDLSLDHLSENQKYELPHLFKRLKQEVNPRKAFQIAKDIQRIWQNSGSESCNLLFSWSGEALVNNKKDQALDYLDNLLMLDPHFSEAWFRKSFIHIQNSDYALALKDLREVLKENPFHFYAMGFLGFIYEQLENDNLAIKIYQKSLELYPQWTDIQIRLDALLEKITATPV